MELETLNKLYLELSQFVTAKTEREIQLEKELQEVDEELYGDARPQSYNPSRAITIRALKKLAQK